MVSQSLRDEIAPCIDLPTQLWVDWAGGRGEPTPRRMDAPRDDASFRPHRGLWTSTWRPETRDSAYVAEIREQMASRPMVERPAWLLTPGPARVWEIRDALAELDLVIMAPTRPIWQQVARVADAAHMTDEGARAFLHLPRDDGRLVLLEARQRAAMQATRRGSGMPLDWWYAESAFWCRWSFTAVERIEDMAVPEIGPG